MKQIIQNYKTGELQLVDVPHPVLRPQGVVIKTINSLVSVGTEKLMVSLARKGYLGKAAARPDLLKQVINKIKTDGLADTYKSVMGRLDVPVTLGYSSAGVVQKVSQEVIGIEVGDRVACFGDGFATHSEASYVPKNMFVKIPQNVSFEEAAFVGLGSIALNAVRIADLTFGEKVVVMGLGLLGQLTIQMLKAFGCKVVGIDISGSKAKLAQEHGCDKTIVIDKEDINQTVADFTKGQGADAVIIMAGSKDNKPIELAAGISRDKGRIVACGMISLDLPRQEFFKKELSVIVSRATGPGKFDPLYENKGIDYPLPYVRWTTQRNMEYFLDLVSDGKVKLQKLITHRFKINRSLEAYEKILSGVESCLGVLIEYNGIPKTTNRVELVRSQKPSVVGTGQQVIGVGLIGAGLHANTSILPALNKLKGINLVGIADAEGFKGRHTGNKYGFQYCVSDYYELLKDDDINAVLISTRHNLHAKMVIDSLQADKHVFVEKPLAMNREELKAIWEVYKSSKLNLMVGFNRRFAPYAAMAKKLIGDASNVVINCRVNAGFVPAESWVYDTIEGGGRVVGEVCHFIDLIQYLSSSVPVRIFAEATAEKGEDNLVITLKMKNGSVATILYASQGNRLLPRERIEIFSGDSFCVIDNFKSLLFAKDGKAKKKGLLTLDRGYKGEFQAFFDSLKYGKIPIDFEEYKITTLTTFAVVESIKTGRTQQINADHY